MDLVPGSVLSEQVHGHAPQVQDQDSVVAVGGQRGLDGVLICLADVFSHHQQVPRGLARLHPPGAFPSVKKACPELTAQAQVALELAEPAGQTAGVDERRPQIGDNSARVNHIVELRLRHQSKLPHRSPQSRRY